MRISSALAALALGACSSPGAPAASAEGEPLACALAGATAFTKTCAFEQANEGGLGGRSILVVHHPDGGFRRFVMLADGGGLAAADGADVAMVSKTRAYTEIAIAGDRYRFPAAKPDAAKH